MDLERWWEEGRRGIRGGMVVKGGKRGEGW